MPPQPPAACVIFSPDWGRYDHLLWRLIPAAEAKELAGAIEDELNAAREASITDPNQDLLKVAYSLSLLADVLQAGGVYEVRDSRLLVSWPDWDGPDGRRLAKAAMIGAKPLQRGMSPAEVERVNQLFAPELDGEDLQAVVREAVFDLKMASEVHPTGVRYQEGFSAALRYWSMPYRGRTGRAKRFVLTAVHPLLGPHPKIAGILELGDEAPFCSWRDNILGLSGDPFAKWLLKQREGTCGRIADHLLEIRKCLKTTSLDFDLAEADAGRVVSERARIETKAQGRSGVLEHQGDLLRDRKRLAHGLRLARGEHALRELQQQGPQSRSVVGLLADTNLMAGVRGLHDLVLPKTHLEATICGAIPPFSQALGGKLLVAFMSHPAVLASTMGGERELLGWSFDLERLSRYLPDHGMLCITTKGLYSQHAPIYSRSEITGTNGPLRMKHLGNTDGVTTSLVSDRTTRLARALLDSSHDAHEVARVSSVYGSGGAKRHRAIDAATIRVGLPPRLAHAGIRRPVYGECFVSNPIATCWLNETPNWEVSRYEAPEAFSARAVAMWRKRWLANATSRVADYAVVPSFNTFLAQRHTAEFMELT